MDDAKDSVLRPGQSNLGDERIATKYAAIGWLSKHLIEDRPAFLAWARMAVQEAAGGGEVVKMLEPTKLEGDPIMDVGYREMIERGLTPYRAEGFVVGGTEPDDE